MQNDPNEENESSVIQIKNEAFYVSKNQIYKSKSMKL